jgi:hypothetical protein
MESIESCFVLIRNLGASMDDSAGTRWGWGPESRGGEGPEAGTTRHRVVAAVARKN